MILNDYLRERKYFLFLIFNPSFTLPLKRNKFTLFRIEEESKIIIGIATAPL
jgi:hypothetical protein